ncbi:GNAT family N-acetyltransferase [Rhodoferax sp. PAMC 29310]|uniref:GNAT family N-acetyltransferase n=1 Tax=Rhodoferax sp. PAMC 29310 TaxID=2822760 RepID=UPI001B34069A|nr:GNAT family N-acetyltransferase [Rhodoferax sp. PAMC 29310]
MISHIDIRLALTEDADAIGDLIKGLSIHFLSHAQGEGADLVLQSIEPGGIAEFIAAERFCHWVACAQEEVIAVAGLRDNAHLYHLFVAPDWQGRGVGRALWRHVHAAALAAGNPDAFTVNSTLTGQDAYRSFGFTATGSVTERDGMAFVPMARYLLSKT